MRKVKLVFEKSFLEVPTFKDTFSKDIEVEEPEGFDGFRLIGARIYESKDTQHTFPGGDVNAPILEYRDVDYLVGKLLTYVDATFTDQEQRKAHKDIVRQMVSDWRNSLETRAAQVVNSHTVVPDN